MSSTTGSVKKSVWDELEADKQYGAKKIDEKAVKYIAEKIVEAPAEFTVELPGWTVNEMNLKEFTPVKCSSVYLASNEFTRLLRKHVQELSGGDIDVAPSSTGWRGPGIAYTITNKKYPSGSLKMRVSWSWENNCYCKPKFTIEKEKSGKRGTLTVGGNDIEYTQDNDYDDDDNTL